MPRTQVRDYMTLSPHTIGRDASLTAAAQRMRELGVRYLPVVERGALRGLLDQRDLLLARALDVNVHELTLDQLMELEPLAVQEETRLTDVARAMAERRAGCAVVMDGASISGILTDNDALGALAHIVDRLERAELAPSAAELRATIAREHRGIRRWLERVERQAQRIRARQSFGAHEVEPLREALRGLCSRLNAHFELEEALLAPALERSDPAWGLLRADRMREDHREQKRLVDLLCADAFGPMAAPAVAAALKLTAIIREDMQAEERALLGPEVLRDDPIELGMETG